MNISLALPLFNYSSFLKELSLILVLLLYSLKGWGQSITYTWTGAGGNSNWTNALNWAPARVIPTATDILVFDHLALPAPTASVVSVTVDFSTQAVAQLRFLNGINTVLTSAVAGGSTIALSSNLTGPEFELVGANSSGTPTSVQLAGAIPLTITLASNNQGKITGNLTFAGGAHRLINTSPATLEFGTGSLFTAGLGFTGNAFGASGANASVIFRSGATYIQQSGASPFGDTNSTVARFDSGSRFVASASSLASNNRTYGNLEVATNNITSSGSGELVILNDLIITSGNVNINVATTRLGGNLTINGGSIAFNGSNSVLKFVGTNVQSIDGTGSNSLIFDRTVEIGNVAGVRLGRSVRIIGGLALTNGILSTTTTNSLTLAATATIAGGSNTSFVNGPLTREVSTATAVVFPIGKGVVYRPITLTINALGVGATAYTAEQINGRPILQAFSGGIKRVSRVRYYTITPDAAPTGFSGQITLSFGPDDEVSDPGAPTFIVGKSNGNVWENIGRSTNTGSTMGSSFIAGTLTSAPFASFGDFALASTEPDLKINPLPVKLIEFSAKKNAAGVQLRWTTASEQNNAGFEVQRSADGQKFETLATIKGHGQSGAHYNYLDLWPLAGLSYYRLHQVDQDGIEFFSPIEPIVSEVIMEFYPNPVQSELYLFGLAVDTHYKVINSLGKVILEGVASKGVATLLVKQLPVGVYQLIAVSVAGHLTRKFIKE